MAEKAAESLFHGQSIDQSRIDEIAMRCEIFGDIADLNAEDINNFYEVKPPEDEGKSKDGE